APAGDRRPQSQQRCPAPESEAGWVVVLHRPAVMEVPGEAGRRRGAGGNEAGHDHGPPAAAAANDRHHQSGKRQTDDAPEDDAVQQREVVNETHGYTQPTWNLPSTGLEPNIPGLSGGTSAGRRFRPTGA